MADVESRPWDPPAWAPGALAAEFEPLPRVGVLQAARRHWLLVLLPILVLVPIAALVAARRTPTYSAEARLIVGQLNISTPGAIAGYAQAAQDLAATYPLVIYGDGVINPVARKLRVPPSTVRGSISATEVPLSSIIRVDAYAKSERLATALANAASNSLISYLEAVGRHDPNLARLSKQLQRSELAYVQAQTKVPRGNGPLTPGGQKLVASAAAAKVQLNGLIQSYQNALQSQTTAPPLQPISYAAAASSDRMSKLQLAVLAALFAGLVIGLAIATLRVNLTVRRAYMMPRWHPTKHDGPSSREAVSDEIDARRGEAPSHGPAIDR